MELESIVNTWFISGGLLGNIFIFSNNPKEMLTDFAEAIPRQRKCIVRKFCKMEKQHLNYKKVRYNSKYYYNQHYTAEILEYFQLYDAEIFVYYNGCIKNRKYNIWDM